jgi:hypothetical protein
MALRLPVPDQTAHIDHQNDLFFNVHTSRFLFGKIPLLHAEALMNDLHLKIRTSVASALGYRADNNVVIQRDPDAKEEPSKLHHKRGEGSIIRNAPESGT